MQIWYADSDIAHRCESLSRLIHSSLRTLRAVNNGLVDVLIQKIIGTYVYEFSLQINPVIKPLL